ncbi:MAG: hypothetical protein PHT13_00885 [Methanosarcina sp.]|nr:hypothetical protein [Methanosarcina sp.]
MPKIIDLTQVSFKDLVEQARREVFKVPWSYQFSPVNGTVIKVSLFNKNSIYIDNGPFSSKELFILTKNWYPLFATYSNEYVGWYNGYKLQ